MAMSSGSEESDLASGCRQRGRPRPTPGLAPSAAERVIGTARAQVGVAPMSGEEILAALASSPADYARFGLDPSTVARWEDGARTDNRAGTYEWWYFDAHLDDGATLV